MIYYIYDASGNIVGLKYNGETYYYLKNNQNDIIGIFDNNNQLIAKYTYDSWGKILSVTDNADHEITSNTHIALLNPFRYRSYYYDTETELYYLNNRYYNAEWGKFINADSIIGTTDTIMAYNLYAYANNDPVNNFELNGNLSLKGFAKNWKNGMKIITRNVSNAINSIKSAGQAVKKKGSQILNNIKNAFVFDVGLGLGIGEDVDFGKKFKNLKPDIYEDVTVKVEKGTVKAGQTFSGNLKYSSGKKEIEVGGNFFHEMHNVEGNVDATIVHSFIFPLFTEIIKCEETEDTLSVVGTHNKYGAEISNDSHFIGFSYSKHIGIGGHIKIGFNISWSN